MLSSSYLYIRLVRAITIHISQILCDTTWQTQGESTLTVQMCSMRMFWKKLGVLEHISYKGYWYEEYVTGKESFAHRYKMLSSQMCVGKNNHYQDYFEC
jgi:hypothetical protein